MNYIITYLILNLYVIVGIIVLNTQPKSVQDFIDNWLNLAPNNASRLIAYLIWPVVVTAAAINAPYDSSR